MKATIPRSLFHCSSNWRLGRLSEDVHPCCRGGFTPQQLSIGLGWCSPWCSIDLFLLSTWFCVLLQSKEEKQNRNVARKLLFPFPNVCFSLCWRLKCVFLCNWNINQEKCKESCFSVLFLVLGLCAALFLSLEFLFVIWTICGEEALFTFALFTEWMN